MKNYYDCVVVGFGTAGSVAAVAAAQNGAQVLVLERGSCPGGTHTAGGFGWYYQQEPVGLMAELDRRCRELTATGGWAPHLCESKKQIIEQQAQQHGITICYEAVVWRCELRNGQIHTLYWQDAAGCHEVQAHCFIDATGDARLCCLAGARLTAGRTIDGIFQPFSNIMLMVKDGNTRPSAFYDAGRINQYAEPDYSRNLLESLSLHLQENFSSQRNWFAPAPLPGIREGRRLKTAQPYSLAEFFQTRGQCAEPIAYAFSNIDIHTNDLALESDLVGEWLIACSMWGVNLGIPVPRRTLLAATAGVANLLVAGRHLAVDHSIGHALRMNALMGAVGEAAGVIASLAAQKHLLPDEVPYSAIAPHLTLTPEVTSNNARIFDDDAESIKQGLTSDTPGFAQWSARENLAVDTLQQWFDTAPANSNLRRHCAIVLALKRSAAGLSELCAMVKERDNFTPKTSRLFNHSRGCAALFCLRLLARSETWPVVQEVYLNEPALEYQMHAPMTLIRLGDVHPELRSSIGELLQLKIADSNWSLTLPRKGAPHLTEDLTPYFRQVITDALNRWRGMASFPGHSGSA